MNTAKKHATHAIKQVELLNFLLNNLQQFNLKPTTKLVLLYLAGCYNPKNADVFPRQKTIALQMGISERSVISAIQELHKEGLVISERKYTNRYRFTSRILNLGGKMGLEDISLSTPLDEKGGMVEDFLQPEEISEAKCKDCTLESENSAPPCIEQEKEQFKEQTYSFSTQKEGVNKSGGNVYLFQSEDDRILEEYARPRAKKSVEGYIKRLKDTGSAAKIISEYKKKKNVTQMALRSIQETQEIIRQNRINYDGSPYECGEWERVGRLFGYKH